MPLESLHPLQAERLRATSSPAEKWEVSKGLLRTARGARYLVAGSVGAMSHSEPRLIWPAAK